MENGGIEMMDNRLSEDLDRFVEHESLRVRLMQKMEKLATTMDEVDGARRFRRERTLRMLERKLYKLDRMDGKRVDRLMAQASARGDRKLTAQLQALRARYDEGTALKHTVLDLDGWAAFLRHRIARGVSTFMLCGAIAMGLGQTGPDRISIVSDELSNREQVHEMTNISGLFPRDGVDDRDSRREPG